MCKFTTAPIFSDYMVFQRGKSIIIFGTGEEGTEITGELAGFSKSTVVRDGKWKLVFPPMGAARYMQLELYDSSEEQYVLFKNIAIGEVWLLSGTYAAELADVGDAVSEPAEETENDVRFYYEGGWKSLSEKENSVGSAFAKRIAAIQDAAVGIVAVDENNAETVAPYTISGVLYYRDSIQNIVSEQYYFYELMRQLLKKRELWQNDEMPIVIGQLPLKSSESESNCMVREAQMKAFRNLKNVGIAVLLDCKNDSRTVGERFAAQALHLVYGGYDGAFSPILRNAIWRDDIVELNFDNAPGGFVVDGEAEGFEVCGDDEKYVPAFADLSGEKIFISSDKIPNPCGVRYLWNRSAEKFVKNGFGLPLAPFRININ